ncbi:hypothetical protein [Streptomyces sp. NPDC058394]|uniref:hypothetical protein n=1 Tax=unclassified Streptomyces TaxID=2593676 RepID=UPI00365E25AA
MAGNLSHDQRPRTQLPLLLRAVEQQRKDAEQYEAAYLLGTPDVRLSAGRSNARETRR